MRRGLSLSFLALVLIAGGCGGQNEKTSMPDNNGGEGGDSMVSSVGGSGGSPATGGGGSPATGGMGGAATGGGGGTATGGGNGSATGGSGGDPGTSMDASTTPEPDASTPEPDASTTQPPDAGSSGNSAADCRAYCTCMTATCAAEAPKKCVETCQAAKDWNLSCRAMACMTAMKDPKMRANDCRHAVGMMGMCTNTQTPDAGAPPPPDAGGHSAAECNAYCNCMAGTCKAQEPAKCVATCRAAGNWDLSCRTMACMDAKKAKDQKARAADCEHAAGMMMMCTDK